jgi:hypothetical protein
MSSIKRCLARKTQCQKWFLKRGSPKFDELMTRDARDGRQGGVRERTKRSPVKRWTEGESKMGRLLHDPEYD